jgi:predicted nucleic acid-binding protein
MAKSRDAYVDTSALIAFVDRSDTYHPLFRQLFAKPPKLLTTSLVISEGHAWFLRRYDRTRALQFLGLIESLRPLSIASVGPKELEAGAAVMRKFSDQDLTLTDAVGLALMKEKKTGTCWSTDFHLGLTGVPLVINET